MKLARITGRMLGVLCLLALAVAAAYEVNPRARGMVWIKHGIMTWGETARASYDAMIEFVSRAEEFIAAYDLGQYAYRFDILSVLFAAPAEIKLYRNAF